MSALLIRARMKEIIDATPQMPGPYAINTTLYAVERPEEHQVRLRAGAG